MSLGGLDEIRPSATEDGAPNEEARKDGERTVQVRAPHLGRYELGAVLGQGAMGIVYEALDTFLDRKVALKTYHATLAPGTEGRAQFMREVQATSALNHPNIVTIFDGGMDGESSFLAMELIEGKSMQELLDRRGKLPARELLDLLVPIADALRCAHQHGIVHRDLKPANVLIAANGQPKLVDFGVAKVLDRDATQVTMHLVGTPSHMAPEQIKGQKVDGRTDVFALAILAYRALTGVKPFAGKDLPAVLYRIVHHEPVPPSQLDSFFGPEVDAVFSRAFAKEPDERTSDPSTFVRDLQKALTAAPPAPTPARLDVHDTRAQRHDRAASREDRAVVIGLVAAACAVTFIAAGWLGSKALATESALPIPLAWNVAPAVR